MAVPTGLVPDAASTPEQTLGRITEHVSYLRVSLRPDGVPASDEWMPAHGLVHDAETLRDVLTVTKAGRGIDRDDIAMSLLVQGYAFRIASIAIGGWLVSGGVVDVGPSNASIAFGRNRPNAVQLDRATWVAAPADDHDATLAALHRHLADDHLGPLIETARRVCRVGGRMLWSNVASSCAASFGAFMGPLADERAAIRDLATRFVAAAGPALHAGGEVVPIGPTWAWQRHACCLYYQQPDTTMCDDCSLHTEPERAERYARILTEAGG